MPDSDSRTEKPPRRWRGWLIRLGLALGGLVLIVALLLLFWLRGALYHRWIQFPREEAAWQALRAARQPVGDAVGWTEYRGVLHSHSHFSHDSEVPFETILDALKQDGLDFICLSDHCVAGRADFNIQWRGLHDGKLFVPGFEMNNGVMPFGVAAGVVLSNSTPVPILARQIAENGGVLFYAHPEEPRDWDRPELVGMEIYNVHVDFKRRSSGLTSILPDLLLNQRRYPDHVVRSLFMRPVAFLKHWDELNQARHITGIAGNDCHQNVGVRGVYTAAGTIRVEDTSPRTLTEIHLNGLTRPLAGWLWGPLEPSRRLFHVQLDPYERMARYVNTHVLARELTEPALLESLRAGRVFVGFDLMVDSSSFRWFASNGAAIAVMGETAAWSSGQRLHAHSPVPCRFTIMKDGAPAFQTDGRALDWAPPGPGKYRVEAEVSVAGEWVPWVYANPIQLQ